MLSEVKVSWSSLWVQTLMRCLCRFPEAFILKIRSFTAPGEMNEVIFQHTCLSSLVWPAFKHVITALSLIGSASRPAATRPAAIRGGTSTKARGALPLHFVFVSLVEHYSASVFGTFTCDMRHLCTFENHFFFIYPICFML